MASIGLDPAKFGTHSLRRTKAVLIYRRTGNLRAVQLLLGHSKIGKRPLGTTAAAACWSAPDRVKHTVLTHVDKDGKAHGCRDHFDGRAPAPLA